MQSVKKRTSTFLALMVLFTMSARSFAFEDVIKVGALLPMTGKLAQIGKNESRAFLMAVDEINYDGGIDGKEIKLIIENTNGDPDKGIQAIDKLINRDNVIAIAGGCSSSVTWKGIEIAQQ